MDTILAALKDGWFVAAAVVGHLIRTESVRTKHETQIAALKEQRIEDTRRLDRRFDELRADIHALSDDVKQLLQRP